MQRCGAARRRTRAGGQWPVCAIQLPCAMTARWQLLTPDYFLGCGRRGSGGTGDCQRRAGDDVVTGVSVGRGQCMSLPVHARLPYDLKCCCEGGLPTVLGLVNCDALCILVHLCIEPVIYKLIMVAAPPGNCPCDEASSLTTVLLRGDGEKDEYTYSG